MKENELNFDKEFMTNPEDEELDEFILGITKMVTESEKGVFVTNQERLKQLLFVYKMMEQIAKGKGTKVSYRLNQPFVSVGSVSIEGKEICISDPAMFVRVSKFASNIEIGFKTNGNVQIDFTFHGLARKVGNLE